MKIEMKCPFCGKSHEIEMTPEEWALYLEKGVNALPRKFNKFQREQLISKMCFECQEKTFGQPMPGNEAAWGEQIGECEVCGAPIWSIRNKKEDGTYECGACHYPFEQ